MKLHPILATHDTVRNWCGPAALAAITGMGTGAAREVIKEAVKDYLGKTGRRIQGMYMDEILQSIKLYSIETLAITINRWEEQITVAQALHKWKPRDNCLFLIRCMKQKNGGHVIVADQQKIVDTFKPKGADYYDHPYINSIVTHIYELSDITCEDL
jgi:hypothetical protein